MHITTKHFLVVGAVLVSGLGVAGAAVAGTPENTRPTAASPAAAATATATENGNVRVETQHGLVLEGSGTLGGQPVMVTVYENSLHGSSVQVVLGDPEDDQIGYAEQAAPFVVDGVLDATVEIDGRLAHLEGSVQESGRPTKLTEPIQDAGEEIITKGTHTQLVTDVTIDYAGTTASLAFAPAFAFDLETRKVALYGN